MIVVTGARGLLGGAIMRCLRELRMRPPREISAATEAFFKEAGIA